MKISQRKYFLLTLILVLLTSCNPKNQTTTAAPTAIPATQTLAPSPTPTPEPEPEAWWQDTVFYEIFVRSFKDSDGDGIGDFQGIIEELDYLNDGDPNTTTDLGISGIWLMPINPSPSYHGYDVTDYYAVNPDYGTMADFKQLLEEAEKRGIKVIMDLVLNHTSDQHPWFLASLDPESPFHTWYVWSETNPQIPGPINSVSWHYNATNSMYYYGVFWSGMPDLNYDNPAVSAEMMQVSKFWLEEVGVDGFRVDAARYLYADGAAQQDLPATIQWFEDWREFYKQINPNAFTVGEVWTGLFVTAKYGHGMDSLFMFDLAEDIKGGVYSPNGPRITKSYQDVLSYFPDMNFSTFLSNHDQQRVMSFYKEDINKARLAAFVYLTGPGSPFIYYGEEVGMIGSKPDEQIRTPMQWTGEPGGGFTNGTPWEPLNSNFADFNVALQDEDPDSLLNHYRMLVQLRNKYPALRTGDYLPFTSNCRQIYPILRIEGDQVLLTLANLSGNEMAGCTLSVDTSPLDGEYQLETVMGVGEFEPVTFQSDGSVIDYALPEVISPWQYFILELTQ